MNIKKCKDAEKIVKSSQLNEGDPIYVEVKTKTNFYKYIGRYIEVKEFKNSSLSKELRIINQEALNFFQNGKMKLSNFSIIRGTKKVWLLSEKDVKEYYESGMNPDTYKKWRRTQI